MELMKLNDIIEKLKDRNLKIVAEKIGIHYNTLYKIANGENKPSYSTLLKLQEYLNG